MVVERRSVSSYGPNCLTWVTGFSISQRVSVKKGVEERFSLETGSMHIGLGFFRGLAGTEEMSRSMNF